MRKTVVALLAVALTTTVSLRAQSAAPALPPHSVPPPAASAGLKIGDLAPDFSLPGSTKDGKLIKPVRLSDLKGQVVVLAFFPKARTSG